MFIQTEVTPNPNSLKFLPEKKYLIVVLMKSQKKIMFRMN